MKFSFNTTGANQPVIREFDIDNDLCVNQGEVVCIKDSKITTQTKGTLSLGVCAETHTGQKDLLNTRANGNKVRVIVGSDSAYEAKSPMLSASLGTSTTLVCEAKGLCASVMGTVKLIRKADGSQNTDSIGTERRILSVAISDNTATITLEEGGVISTGDEYVLIPDIGHTLYLDENRTGVVFENAQTDVCFKVIGTDKNLSVIYMTMCNALFA